MRFVPMVASAVVAATALTATAQASGDIAYLGLRGSYVQTDDGDTVSGVIDYKESYDDGFAAAVFMGWVLDENFRFELEGGFRSTDIDSILITRNDIDNTTEGQHFDVGGHAQVGAFMTNLYYDIHCFGDIGFLPWVGAGVGGAYIDYATTLIAPTFTLAAQDNTWAFAYQFMAGVTVPLGDSISGSVGYRYFQTEDFTYVDAFGLGFQTQLTQQSIDVGVQFHL